MVTAKVQPDKRGDPLKLVIVPPPDIHLPATLLSQSVARPSQLSASSAAGIRSDNPRPPHPIRCHTNFIKTRKSLSEVNLSLRSPLLADRGMWLSLVVDEVEFDLATDEVRIALIDATNYTWDFAELDRQSSSDSVCEEGEADLGAMIGLADEGFIATRPFEPISTSAQSLSPSQDRLHQLTLDLRTAFEDLKLSATLDSNAPQVSTDADYATLVDLAADPALPLPLAWRGQQGDKIGRPIEGETVNEPVGIDRSASESVKGPSPLSQSSLPIEEGDDLADGDPEKHKGQLRSRCRPFAAFDTCNAHQVDSNRPPAAQARHILLTIIELLSTIRRTMLDLFSLKMLALLRVKVGAPTYPLWAAKGGAKWCRRMARQKGAQVSRLVLQLLDDVDGDQFDRDEEIDELDDEAGRMELEDEGEWAGFGGFGGFFLQMDGRTVVDSPTEVERKERRRRRNIFYHMRDDYDLRMWCQRANSRIIVGWEDSLGEEEIDSDEGGPHWLRQIPPWEVSKPYSRPGGPNSVGRIRQPRTKKVAAASSSHPGREHAAASQGFGPTRGHFSIYGAVTPPSSPATSPPSSGGDSDATNSDDGGEGGGRSDGMLSGAGNSEVFEVEDPLGAELLPRRLPKALVRAGGAGREMAQMRHKIHLAFNEIAGLQKKTIELERFVKVHSAEWDRITRDEHTPRQTEIGPKPRVTYSAAVAQPLRISTADRTISHSINASLKQNGKKLAYSASAASFSRATPPTGSHKRGMRPPVISPPRKRQKQNVETITSVLAAQRAQAEGPARTEPAGEGAAAVQTGGLLARSLGKGGLLRPASKVDATGKEKEKGKGLRSPRRTLSWPNGSVTGPRTTVPTPGGGLLPAPAISASLRAAIANPAGLLITGLNVAPVRPPTPARPTSSEDAAAVLPKLASCSYTGPSLGGAVPAASVPWITLSSADADGGDQDEAVHDIEVDGDDTDLQQPASPGLLPSGRGFGGPSWEPSERPGKAGGGGVLAVSESSHSELADPSGEHLRGRVIQDLEAARPAWAFWSTGQAKMSTGAVPALWRSQSPSGTSPVLSPERPGSSFPKSFGAYSLSALPQTPPWEPSGLVGDGALPKLQQPDAFPTSAERQTGVAESPPLVSLPSLSTVLGEGASRSEAQRTPVADAAGGDGRAAPARIGLVAPRPRRGVEASAFAAGPFRPAWISAEAGEVEKAEVVGGVARLSPERLGLLRRRTVSPVGEPVEGHDAESSEGGAEAMGHVGLGLKLETDEAKGQWLGEETVEVDQAGEGSVVAEQGPRMSGSLTGDQAKGGLSVSGVKQGACDTERAAPEEGSVLAKPHAPPAHILAEPVTPPSSPPAMEDDL